MVFTPPLLKHDLSYYKTWQGFDNEKKPLPSNLNIDTNEYVIRLKRIYQIL